MERLLNAMTILSIVLMLVILYSVRRSHIRVEYSVSWLAAAFLLLVLSRSPGRTQLDRRATGANLPARGLDDAGLLRVCGGDLPLFGGYLRSERREHCHDAAARHRRIPVAESQ